MAKRIKEKTYWPHMILGFLVVGITLSYWTVKSASSVPVQESNNYMMKYQQADMHINEIMEARIRFNQKYHIILVGAKKTPLQIENAKRAKVEDVVLLKQGNNSFTYKIIDKDNHFIADMNVTFLLTRPHTVKEDILVRDVPVEESVYKVNNIMIDKPGRYILQCKAKIGNVMGYSEIPAYLQP